MNWGYKIAILYTGFVALIVTMVVLSSREKVDLVAADYYEQELHFQEKINNSGRSNSLQQPLSWSVETGALVLSFPEEFNSSAISGSVYFQRPSDAAMDRTVSIPAGSERIKTIPTAAFPKGIYKMEISWEVNKEKYYNEGIIQIH